MKRVQKKREDLKIRIYRITGWMWWWHDQLLDIILYLKNTTYLLG